MTKRQHLTVDEVLENILSDDEEDLEEPMREGSDYEFSDMESDEEEDGKYNNQKQQSSSYYLLYE